MNTIEEMRYLFESMISNSNKSLHIIFGSFPKMNNNSKYWSKKKFQKRKNRFVSTSRAYALIR